MEQSRIHRRDEPFTLWQEVFTRADNGRDADAAQNAARFVEEYERLLDDMAAEKAADHAP